MGATDKTLNETWLPGEFAGEMQGIYDVGSAMVVVAEHITRRYPSCGHRDGWYGFIVKRSDITYLP